MPNISTSSVPPILELESVCLQKGGKPILRGTSLQVRKGEWVSVIGPSGAGKSTLLRCINGLDKPQSGTVRLFNQSIHESRRALIQARKKIGTIFQAYNLYSLRSALDNVMFAPLKILGLSRSEAEARARACLEKVGIADLADRFPFQLSGGQQQRVAIARALIMDPELLLLDEPTSALDPELIKSLVELLHSLSRSGLTAVCVTHEHNFARKMSNRMVLMAEGTIVPEISKNVTAQKIE